MRPQPFKLIIAGLAFAVLAGCASPSGDTPAEKRQAAQKMRSETLAKLYEAQPKARKRIAKAQGYAVFSNVGVHVIFLSGGNGWGIAHDNRTGRDVYMKMGTVGIGLGLGVKDFRGVFVFTKRGALKRFINKGWNAGAEADAAAKAGRKGGAFAGAVDVAPGIKLYQLTENGLALQATINGTKYWKDDDLNGSQKAERK
jgi:lipid-binding SYLF domain-containing protein